MYNGSNTIGVWDGGKGTEGDALYLTRRYYWNLQVETKAPHHLSKRTKAKNQK